MSRKTIFANKKYILSSGRELDLTGEVDGSKITITSMFNVLDPVSQIGHAALFRIENDQTVSFESLSAKTPDENYKEFIRPIEGLNGSDISLKIFELNELISVMQQFLQKIDKEIVVKK